MNDTVDTKPLTYGDSRATCITPNPLVRGLENSVPTSAHGIAICSVGELFGGVERHLLGALNGLRERRITPLFLLFHDGELAAQARELGVEPTILMNDKASILAAAKRLAFILMSHRIRLVHAHGYKAMIYCALARRHHAFTLVKTEHGLPEPMRGSLIRSVRGRLYRLLDIVATRVAASAVYYVTKEIQDYYRSYHAGLPAVTVPNGIASIERGGLQRPPELNPNNFNLIIVGRLDTVKGHEFAITAIASAELPRSIHLHIVGNGPRESELRELAMRLDVASRVHFLGFRRNVYDYVAHSDVLLMPSLHEGLPYTLLEAMELGVPILAAAVGGLAEVLKDGVNGLLIPPRDTRSITDAIHRLYRDPQLRAQLVKRARHDRRSRYSLDSMSAGYVRRFSR